MIETAKSDVTLGYLGLKLSMVCFFVNMFVCYRLCLSDKRVCCNKS